MARNSQYTLLVLMILFGNVRGLAFVTEPNNTVLAFTGFNQTFTWALNLTEEDKSKELKVQFGSWNKKYSYVNYYLMTFVREPSGKENEVKANESTAKRLYWTGDLSRDYHIAFQLVNIKRDDSGDYGIRLRADYNPPWILESWFTLSVQDPPAKPSVESAYWPAGPYGIPKAASGCPYADGFQWLIGRRYQDTEDNNPKNHKSPGFHLDATEDSKMGIIRSFCMKTDTSTDVKRGSWPPGKYCIYKKGGSCPTNLTSGFIKWDDEDDNNRNNETGTLPDGVYDQNTKIEFCCRTDGDKNVPISLPSLKPFFLLAYDSAECQQVKWAVVSVEWIRFDNEDIGNADGQGGSHPHGAGIDDHKIHYCYYQGCNQTLTGVNGTFLSPNYPQKYPDGQYCSWRIKVSPAKQIHLTFSNFSLQSENNTDALYVYDGANATGEVLGVLYGGHPPPKKGIYSLSNHMFVIFKSDKNVSYTGFNASYSAVDYLGSDGGWSNWNAWGSCSVTCGGGSQTRHRTCTNPPPRPHLLYCQGSRLQARLCNTNNCPIRGGWSDWNEWSLCTKAIGGIQIRTRECVNPKPRYGGKPCSGNRVFARECGNTSSCHEAFPVRFRTEEIPSLGTMEIFKNKTWEKLCTTTWDDSEENLTCRAMGYFNNGPNENSTRQDGRNGSNTTVHLSCRSMTHDCVNNSKDDLQKCKVPVRLSGANIEYGGRVEVFYRGKWGKICRKEWGLDDVKVVCNQLGFKGALAEFIASEVKEENIPYLMSKVSCSGHESDLASCQRTDGDYDCPDDKGAQALCEPKNREVLEKKTFVSDIGSIETFRCSLPNDTSMTKWYDVKGANISLSGGRIKASRGTLTISNVQLSDGGTYECRGLKYTRFYTIYVNAIFKDTHIRQTLISGTSAILKCSAAGTLIPQFDEWKEDGNKTLDEGRFTQMSNGNLRVYPVRPEDQGTYTCAMKQNKGKGRITTKYRTIHVSVVVPPNIQVSEPKLTVREGENVSLACIINEGTTPKIHWYKDESPIDGRTVLHLTEVTAEDEGWYTCKAENEGGSSNDSTFVTVDVPPKVNPEMMNQSVPLSSAFAMECIVGGNPSPKVNWTKDGRHLANNSTTLHISHVTIDDAGQYGCSAENRAGKIRNSFWMDVTVSPQVYVSPTNQTVPEGKATNISCKVTSGVPKPSLSWNFEGGHLPEEVFETEIESGSVLQMQYTTKGMEGTYQCVAENKASKAIVTSTLRVLEKPTVEISPESYPPFMAGDKLILVCKVSGKRVEVKWKKNGSPVTPRARISRNGDKNTIVIENVEGGDGGDYSCEAHNDAGFTISTVVIDVRGRMTFGNSLSGGLFLECTNNGMIVTLDHRSIANVDLDKVTLNDSYCELSKHGSLNSTHLSMIVPLDSCMTKHSTEGDTITYENILIIKTREYTGAAKISREFKASFPFKCSYPRSAVVSVASFSPRQKVIHIKTAEYGNLTIAMDLYETGEYETPYVGYPVAFDLNEKMYVEVKITSDEAQLVIIPLKCWGTPDPDKADGMSYAFIDKGCKKDDTLVYDYKESTVQRFTLDAFRFLGESADAEVYLRCSVEACLKGDSESRCAKGCEENSSRKRRGLSLDALAEHIVTIGPVSRQKQSSVTVHEQQKSKSSLSVFAVVAGVLAVAVLALTVALVMLYKRYRSPQNAPRVVYFKASSEDRV